MSSTFHVKVAEEHDIPELVALISQSFTFVPVEAILFGDSSPENLAEVSARHLHAWHLHAKVSETPCAIKCIHTDLATGVETLAGMAYWWIHTRDRMREEYTRPDYLRSGVWITNSADREKALAFCQPFVDGRSKWMGGRPHGLLMYMCVKPEWRRKGVASMCVQWGLDQCARLGIPAFLDASEEGVPVYEKLGFEVVEWLRSPWNGEVVGFPAMVCWPVGTREEDKRPARS